MKFTSINEYISTLPENAQKAMGEIIAAIKDVVPDADRADPHFMERTFKHRFHFIKRHIHELFCERKDMSHADAQNGIVIIRRKTAMRFRHCWRTQRL